MLSQNARQKMHFAFAGSGQEIADVIDAGTGTLSKLARERLTVALGNRSLALQIIPIFEAGSPLDAAMVSPLGFAISSLDAALEIRDELAA